MTSNGAHAQILTPDHGEPLIIVPKSAPHSAERFPLVLLLHGYMADQNWINTYFGYGDQVQNRKFILLAPNGLKNSSGLGYWNASPACCDFDHHNNDDVGYLKGLLEDTIQKYPVDEQRIFVVGHSNGGFMAHRLACEFSETVTGIISFAGMGLSKIDDCHLKKPIAVLQIHAIDDEVIRFEGDPKGYNGLSGYPSAAQTVDDWRIRNQCQALSPSSLQMDLVASIPGIDTTVDIATNCLSNSAVQLWKIRPYKNQIYTAHSPKLGAEFTQKTLDFIFSHPRTYEPQSSFSVAPRRLPQPLF